MRNHFVYKDKKVKKFNHVTVVEGDAEIKESTVQELDDLDMKIASSLWMLSNPEAVIARSKCSPEDTYDEKKGLIVASRKAELKSVKRYLNRVTELKKYVQQLLTLTQDIEDQLDFKMVRLSLDLVRNAREGKE